MKFMLGGMMAFKEIKRNDVEKGITKDKIEVIYNGVDKYVVVNIIREEDTLSDRI